MKKRFSLSLLIVGLAATSALLSFTTGRGGDMFEILLNGKLAHRQFVHNDKSVKTLQLPAHGNNDRIEVFYSHCGQPGMGRVLTLRNEKKEVVKVFRFADAKQPTARIGFYRKSLATVPAATLNLYYSSKELPAETLLVSIAWSGSQSVAKQ